MNSEGGGKALYEISSEMYVHDLASNSYKENITF